MCSSDLRSLVPSLVIPRGVPIQVEEEPEIVNDADEVDDVGKVFQNLNSLFVVNEATTFFPSDHIPHGQASAPRSMAKLALAPELDGIVFQTRILLLSESATRSLLSGVITASLGQLH